MTIMKKVIVATVIAVGWGGMIGMIFLKPKINYPKSGEVWRWFPNPKSDNPFHPEPYDIAPYYTYKVIAVKGDYVQYMDVKDSSIQSSDIGWASRQWEKVK